jgi:hypothetical protein
LGAPADEPISRFLCSLPGGCEPCLGEHTLRARCSLSTLTNLATSRPPTIATRPELAPTIVDRDGVGSVAMGAQ